MSGPYPPQGYPQQPGQGGWPAGQYDGGGWAPPDQGSWGGGRPERTRWEQPAWGGQPERSGWPGGQPEHGGWDPNQPAPGPPGGGGRPPRRRNAGQLTIAIVAVVVIVGGVAAGILLLNNRHQRQQASPAPATTSQRTPSTGTAPTSQAATNSANGTTTLAVSPGECVTAVVAGDQYSVTKRASCGASNSDFILDKAVRSLDGCSPHQYVVVQGAQGAVYCFTLDLKSGDCLDTNYLKVPCTGAAYTVLKTEAGPGTSDSCRDAEGASHWLPADRNPVQVACIGPHSH